VKQTSIEWWIRHNEEWATVLALLQLRQAGQPTTVTNIRKHNLSSYSETKIRNLFNTLGAGGWGGTPQFSPVLEKRGTQWWFTPEGESMMLAQRDKVFDNWALVQKQWPNPS